MWKENAYRAPAVATLCTSLDVTRSVATTCRLAVSQTGSPPTMSARSLIVRSEELETVGAKQRRVSDGVGQNRISLHHLEEKREKDVPVIPRAEANRDEMSMRAKCILTMA